MRTRLKHEKDVIKLNKAFSGKKIFKNFIISFRQPVYCVRWIKIPVICYCRPHEGPRHPKLLNGILHNWESLCDIRQDCHRHIDANVIFNKYSNKFKSLLSLLLDSLRRRACARNVSFRISLRWPMHIINSVYKTKLSCNTPTVSLETYPLYSFVV